MNRLRYSFSPECAVQAAGYLLERLGGSSDKIKLMKLLYLAERDHFLANGRPITGDSMWALPHGPSPSCTLNLLNGHDGDESEYVFKHIVPGTKQFALQHDPGSSCLEESDKEILDSVLDKYGQMHTWAIREYTHKLPEYIECEVAGSSAPIPYEVILRLHGGEAGFRYGRPVISAIVQAHALCPFERSEPDL